MSIGGTRELLLPRIGPGFARERAGGRGAAWPRAVSGGKCGARERAGAIPG